MQINGFVFVLFIYFATVPTCYGIKLGWSSNKKKEASLTPEISSNTFRVTKMDVKNSRTYELRNYKEHWGVFVGMFPYIGTGYLGAHIDDTRISDTFKKMIRLDSERFEMDRNESYARRCVFMNMYEAIVRIQYIKGFSRVDFHKQCLYHYVMEKKYYRKYK